jgi:hypothetical protein
MPPVVATPTVCCRWLARRRARPRDRPAVPRTGRDLLLGIGKDNALLGLLRSTAVCMFENTKYSPPCIRPALVKVLVQDAQRLRHKLIECCPPSLLDAWMLRIRPHCDDDREGGGWVPECTEPPSRGSRPMGDGIGRRVAVLDACQISGVLEARSGDPSRARACARGEVAVPTKSRARNQAPPRQKRVRGLGGATGRAKSPMNRGISRPSETVVRPGMWF